MAISEARSVPSCAKFTFLPPIGGYPREGWLLGGERCQRLAYISKGKLLAAGTVDEVISSVGLTTWSVRGPDLAQLAEQLRKTPGVQQAVAFGNSLHVSSNDAAALERAIAPFRHEPYDWRQIPSGLEDAFISLMEHDKAAA